MNKNIGKNISKNSSQKLVHDAKISATNALKTASKGTIQKTEGTTENCWKNYKSLKKLKKKLFRNS